MSSRAFKFNFSEGEKVLCYEPDPNKAKVLYDSKILECCIKKDSKSRKSAEYLVHFYGWNSSWDRHVAECNILKDNPENRALQRQLAEIAAEPLKGKKLKLNKIPAIIREVVVSSPRENVNESEGKDGHGDGKLSEKGDGLTNHSEDSDGKSEMNSDNIQSESSQHDDGPLLQPSFMQLPKNLKKILEEDSERIEGRSKCYTIPAKTNVKMILAKYLSENFEPEPSDGCSSVLNITTRTRTSSAKKEVRYIVREFSQSIEKYFNSLLCDHLLYGHEKNQLYALKRHHRTTDPSAIYGFVHLLRLLVILPDFFIVTPGITRKQMNTLFKLFQEFFSFLSAHQAEFYEK